ncbi:MAG: class I SAM-dependent methyltransferase [Candidatus Vogelbacteria bacterium]|nr:class I SAM-dependent methyltransferase [Candidatus Vogelbacteria bacterium]
MKQDPSIYDGLSLNYAEKRYTGKVDSYIKYIFTTRRSILTGFFKEVLNKIEKPSVFEIGCADGVLARFLRQQFPEQIGHFVGVDISSEMIKLALSARIVDADFYLRDQLNPDFEASDVVMEVGVHTGDWSSEIAYWRQHLKPDGFLIKSVAGRQSIYARLKLYDRDYYQDYSSYREYEKIFNQDFDIIATKSYGIFIPKIWRWPALARPIQMFFDQVLVWFPELYHERVYLLKKR